MCRSRPARTTRKKRRIGYLARMRGEREGIRSTENAFDEREREPDYRIRKPAFYAVYLLAALVVMIFV